MRWLFAAVFALHGVIHFLGVAHAVKPAAFPQLDRVLVQLPPRVEGGGWALAGVLFLAAALALAARLDGWWTLLAGALVVSQVLVVSAWPSAKFGTVVNVVALVVALASLALARFDARAAAQLEPP